MTSGARPPEIAVVIATRGRPERLARLLRAIARQRAGEVTVVLDGADPASEAVLAAPPRGLAGTLPVERHAAARGPAAARNTGWRAANAPGIAFTDDDCEPAPGWLAALAASAGPLGRDDVVLQGRVEPHPAERHRLGPFARTLEISAAGPWFQTANVLYPRALLERLGGFDETYPA